MANCAPIEELDLKEIYQARELIEPVVLRQAVPLYTAAHLNAIEACFARIEGWRTNRNTMSFGICIALFITR